MHTQMYLPPRSSGAAVHEYLTPGVEIVSVDPNCAYNSPISLSDTSVSDADDDECHSAATDDYLMQMNQHQHALGVVVVDDDDDDEAEEEEEEEDDFDVAVRAGIAASPAAYAEAADVARASGNSAMCPTTSRSQTCLGKMAKKNTINGGSWSSVVMHALSTHRVRLCAALCRGIRVCVRGACVLRFALLACLTPRACARRVCVDMGESVRMSSQNTCSIHVRLHINKIY